MAFTEKSIFVWNDYTIGDAAKVAGMLKVAGFEAALLHSVSPANWRTASRVALVGALKAAGIKVYASCAVYGDNPTADGLAVAGIVNQYSLEGAVFDVESGQYETAADAGARVGQMFDAYNGATDKPSAFCGWPFYESMPTDPKQTPVQWHPRAVLIEAMKRADVAMPMAYWYWGSDPAPVVLELAACYNQWRKYTNKPIVAAGRAYNDRDIITRPDAIAAYEAKARSLGAVGVTWWDMEHALKIPGVWDALTALPKFGTAQPEPEEPPMTNPYKQNALGYYAKSVTDPGWNNPAFAFIVAQGCRLDGIEKPNAELKPMQLLAAEKGLPFIISLDFTVRYYTGQQYNMEESRWPDLAMDYPLQRFISIAQNREYKEIWLNFTDGLNHNNEPAGAAWLEFGLRVFIKKAKEWAAANRPGLKIRVMTNWAFMRDYVAGGPAWITNGMTGAKQDALTPLDASYPQAQDKPGWLGVAAAGPFWWYTGRLIMFDGSAQELAALLGTTTPQEPPTDPLPTDPDLKALQQQVNALQARTEALEGKYSELERAFMEHKHPHKHAATVDVQEAQ